MKDYEEQYVTFETAKLLDKAGFNYKCRQFYLHDGGRWPYTHQTVLPQNEPACHAPTQAQAMRWLRSFGKVIEIKVVHHPELNASITFEYRYFVYDHFGKHTPKPLLYFEQYEECVEEAIKYAISLLEGRNDYEKKI